MTGVGVKPLLNLIEISGVISFALSGMLEARRKNMDLVGVYAVALITAFGGGTVRDVLLDRRPLFWVSHPLYAPLILGMCVIFLYAPNAIGGRVRLPSERFIAIPDALGLGLFCVTGAYYAREQGMTLFISSMFGVITGIFGGILRDIICNQIPVVFSHTSLYATCAFAGCWTYLIALRLGLDEFPASLTGAAVTSVLRILAMQFNIGLPQPREL
ncbi:MAG: trimeric intracellular cation channel family protein [Acidobacteriales bacterium]|nr:trimeric intracellular cation channel family protein [Terriglobales bacterium]